VGFDLLLGQRRRNWARGWNAGGEVPEVAPPVSARSPLSSSSLLERNIRTMESPDGEARFPTVKEKLRAAVPAATKLYDDYRPTYRDH
jgi:hypothetical protein